MPNINRYKQLYEMIRADEPDAERFKSVLETALSEGFLINGRNIKGETPLHWAANWHQAAGAGLLQILIDAGADVNMIDLYNNTPLGLACWEYVCGGGVKRLAAVDILLKAGARSGPDERWTNGWDRPGQQARRDWLEAYIASWPERRAAGRGKEAAPAFDYAL